MRNPSPHKPPLVFNPPLSDKIHSPSSNPLNHFKIGRTKNVHKAATQEEPSKYLLLQLIEIMASINIKEILPRMRGDTAIFVASVAHRAAGGARICHDDTLGGYAFYLSSASSRGRPRDVGKGG